MDKFTEMMKKMMAMTEAERSAMMEKNRALCTCGACPTYNACARTKNEAMFCATGKSACTLTRKACICPGCPITPMLGLQHGYYCFNGTEKEQRGMK
jgi:Protein of unknown function (DUF2769)